ncbi:MAG: hypothetical protein ABI859_02625 [Pseudomonadota bacterium]
MGCDLLQGLDLDALSPQAWTATPVHLPDGLGTARLREVFPRGDAPLTGRLARCPQRAANNHGRALVGSSQPPAPRFAQRAIDEFREFWQAQLDGEITSGRRFQISLPTPYTLLTSCMSEQQSLALLPEMERAVVNELAIVMRELPPELLALQWDVCGETRVWETRGRNLASPRGLPERLLASFVTVCAAIPATVDLGFHFCHREALGSEAIVPSDAGQVARLLGAIIASCDRDVAFVHVPVPATQVDSRYFEPLANLALWPQMQVYLGLLHPEDDTAAAADRLVAAQCVLRNFGISVACGCDPATAMPRLAALLHLQDEARH